MPRAHKAFGYAWYSKQDPHSDYRDEALEFFTEQFEKDEERIGKIVEEGGIDLGISLANALLSDNEDNRNTWRKYLKEQVEAMVCDYLDCMTPRDWDEFYAEQIEPNEDPDYSDDEGRIEDQRRNNELHTYWRRGY